METIKVLVIEDSENDFELIQVELLASVKSYLDFKCVMSKYDFIKELKDFAPDIILSDFNLPQFNGLDALKIALDLVPNTPFIIVTGALPEERAVDCIKAGAWDYVAKERLSRLPIAFEASLKLKNEKEKNRKSELELKLIKEKMGVQLKLLYDAIDRAPSSVVITDIEGSILYVNPSFVKITGYTKEEAIGQNPRVLKSGYQNNDFYKALWDTVLSGKEWTGEILNKKKNGDLYWEKASIAPISDENGKIVNFVAIKHDITELKVHEEKLRQSENWYKSIFGNTGTATCIIDADNTISLVNNKFEELSGYSKEEIEGIKLWTEFVSPRDLVKMMDYHEKRFEKQDVPKMYEFTFIDRKGEKSNILLTVDLIAETNKAVASLLDITERKKFEAELINAKERAEESVRLKSAFISTMSHELRTPLNVILGFSALIDQDTPTAEMLDMVKIINTSGNDLLSIIESVFDISMLKAKEAKINKDSCSISELFAKFNYYLAAEQSKKNKEHINILFAPAPNSEDLIINTDKTLVSQLITNLLNNAIKFTSKGSIEYGYNINNRDITFFVKDTGIGIPADKTNIIFDQFRQVDDSHTRKYGGVGLGLSICKEIATLLDGDLWVESEYNSGSVFYFHLPNVLEHKNKEEVKTFQDTSIPNLEDRNILIAEDLELNYLLISKMLKKTKANIFWAKNGRDAIYLVEEKPEIDTILMDIRMPILNGYEATKEIKRVRPDIYIIAQTAYALEEEKEKIFEAGCDAYISKPIERKKLFEVLLKEKEEKVSI